MDAVFIFAKYEGHGHAKIKTAKRLKVCTIKCSKCSQRIHKPLIVLQLSANLGCLPFMVFS
jgi:hypothetical protein